MKQFVFFKGLAGKYFFPTKTCDLKQQQKKKKKRNRRWKGRGHMSKKGAYAEESRQGNVAGMKPR